MCVLLFRNGGLRLAQRDIQRACSACRRSTLSCSTPFYLCRILLPRRLPSDVGPPAATGLSVGSNGPPLPANSMVLAVRRARSIGLSPEPQSDRSGWRVHSVAELALSCSGIPARRRAGTLRSGRPGCGPGFGRLLAACPCRPTLRPVRERAQRQDQLQGRLL